MDNKLFIVGIGASAGGLEAIGQLIAHLRPEAPCAYVVLQHLSPNYRSMMVDILARETSLKVKEAEQGDLPRAGHLYVAPANHNALIRDGRLVLVTAPPEVTPKPSINQFLISLAAEEGEAAVGIILSGTGSDGVAGLRAIQAAGGFTLAQKPETAKYDGMPRAAIEAGVADHILSPEEIARELPRLLELPPPAENEPAPELLDQLFVLLRETLSFDFSGYKTGTLLRRIRRREIATGVEDFAAYMRLLEQHPEELEHLARDILISVTAFFRDKEAFAALRHAVAEICARKAREGEIRVWVAGCASGEEAYSIAMLFADFLGERLGQTRVQIFATDIDDDALNIARRGVYPAAAMAEVPPELLERFFLPADQRHEAGKLLRDMIVFARHNLVSDPPFLRLDLVSCRNVLIYFDAPLQSKVLHTFHFGLVKDGFLFLGRSESVAQADALFQPVDRRERLFQRRGETPPLSGPTPMPPLRSPAQRREQKTEALLQGLCRHFGLTAALCDVEGNIQHSAGQVERYLQFPTGVARLAIGEVAATPLRGELLTLLHRCGQQGKPQRGRRRRLGEELLRMHVEPLENRQVLVLFLPETTAAAAEPEPVSTLPDRVLEDELIATREHLQTLVEEMATANEEMQALNEEAQASNEELQATNEEMEAANEELQATNEELVSLNEELNVKNSEYARLSEEYAHLYDALDFPILVFDRGLLLQRYNAPAARRFDLRPGALRQPPGRLRLDGLQETFETLLGRALAHHDREDRLISLDGRNLHLAVTPGLDRLGEVASLVATLIDVSDITLAQEALKESERRLAVLMEKTTVIFAMKDATGAYLYANRRFLEFFGLGADDYIGRTDFQLLSHDLAASLWGLDLEALHARAPVSREHRLTHAGATRHLRTVHQVLPDATGKPAAFITEAEDITADKQAQEQLRITARVFDQAGEAIVVTDAAGVIQTVNPAFASITGYGQGEAPGQPMSILKSGRHTREFYQSMWESLLHAGFWQGEIWNRRKSGDIYPEWLTINRVDDEAGVPQHYVAVFSDITSIKETQRRAEYLATHDTLTGLPNRALFHDHLRQALAQARRKDGRFALMFIDLDNFKTINDTLGHDVGDELLKQAALRLKDAVRDVDTVARLGGDEFTAILVEADAAVATQVGRRLNDDLARSFEAGGRTLFVSASIGVAFYPDDGGDSASLIKAADNAMYRSKEQGRNRMEFFKPDMQVRLLKRAALESALREALRQDRLRLVYQPQFGLGPERRLQGAEALLRWNDPELGEVSPAEFIPVAEACGLILDIGRSVSTLAARQIAAWRQLGLAPPPIAVNVSPRCIREQDFAGVFLDLLARHGVPSEHLIIEITETALLENVPNVRHNLDVLDQAGIDISIDDFGTGYSSLAYLKRLPLDELKIDKEFVDGLGQDKEDEAIARAVLALAQALELRTVAEGVETQRQLDWLARHGCDGVQGYLLGRPLEVHAFEDILAAAHARKSRPC